MNLDQETIFKFFGISDPNVFFSNLKSEFFAPLSIPVKFETLKLLSTTISSHLKYGLGLIEIENIALFILFIRFIILAFRYNLKTSFYICLISLGGSILWYLSIKDVLLNYKHQLVYLNIPIISRMKADLAASKNIAAKYQFEVAYSKVIGNKLGNYEKFGDELRDPFDFLNLKFAFLQGAKVVKSEEYWADPFSMIFARLPIKFREVTDPIYYKLIKILIPEIWSTCIRQLKLSLPTIFWLYFTRKRKRFCPYFIRWHWTFLLAWDSISDILQRFVFRLAYYAFRVLKPNKEMEQFAFILTIIKAIILLQIMFTLYGLFHALFSQYFYVPFLTENSEMHIGPRPKNSIYSGGYTEWQDYFQSQILDVKTGNFSKFPRLWHGWFGKDRKIPKRINSLITKLFSKILKKLKKIIFKK